METNYDGQNKEVFERLYNRSLTNQELFTIRQNLVGFFNVLIKIDEQSKGNVSEKPKQNE